MIIHFPERTQNMDVVMHGITSRLLGDKVFVMCLATSVAYVGKEMEFQHTGRVSLSLENLLLLVQLKCKKGARKKTDGEVPPSFTGRVACFSSAREKALLYYAFYFLAVAYSMLCNSQSHVKPFPRSVIMHSRIMQKGISTSHVCSLQIGGTFTSLEFACGGWLCSVGSLRSLLPWSVSTQGHGTHAAAALSPSITKPYPCRKRHPLNCSSS